MNTKYHSLKSIKTLVSKKLIFLSIVCLALIKPENCSARIIQGWATITQIGPNNYILKCPLTVSGACCSITGNIVRINHWSGEIIVNLLGELPFTIQNNFPIPFTTENPIQHD